MKLKVVSLAILAQIFASILTVPLLIYAGLSVWADQCTYSDGTLCQTNTMIGLLLFVVVLAFLVVFIGKTLLKRFAGYRQDAKKATTIIIIIGLIVIGLLPELLALMSILTYPAYTLIEYSSKTPKVEK